MDRFGGPDVLKVIDVSIASPRPEQILVRVEAAGVLYGDVMRRTNRYLTETPLPYAPGTEIAGTVVEIGKKVSGLKVGDRVLCRVGSQGYSQYALAEVAQTFSLPDGIGFAEATALLAQGVTAYLLTHDVATMKGKAVFIESVAGGVGMQMAQMAKTLGAAFVAGSASTEEKRDFARKNGVDLVVSSLEQNWSEQIMKATKGRGVDVGFESSGASFVELLRCLSSFGTLVKFGRGVDERQSFDPTRLVGQNQTLRGFYLPGYFDEPHRQLLDTAMHSLIDAVLNGVLKVEISHRYPLQDASLAHRAIEERRTMGKVVLEPWKTKA
ncbi:zinc-binding dehydrogenase [Acidisphaera sp. L21]|uniref:quinone oxidoreductase family protein n=1 Tax=Acidisphaera sp. L21 TaxID=1641851 RepID=UPI00131BC10D|nr:zinc-binding dehydrogenase [Acidisphaera sp. L21]